MESISAAHRAAQYHAENPDDPGRPLYARRRDDGTVRIGVGIGWPTDAVIDLTAEQAAALADLLHA